MPSSPSVVFFHSNEVEKFHARLWARKRSSKGRCSGDGILLFYSAHHHAEVLCFDDHSNAVRLECLLDALEDLMGEALLDLEPTSKDVDDTRQLAQSDNFAVGDIGDMCFADKGQQMVFAEGIQLDVFDNDHFTVGLIVQGRSEYGIGILCIAPGQKLPGFGDPHRGLLQTLSVGIFAQ